MLERAKPHAPAPHWVDCELDPLIRRLEVETQARADELLPDRVIENRILVVQKLTRRNALNFGLK